MMTGMQPDEATRPVPGEVTRRLMAQSAIRVLLAWGDRLPMDLAEAAAILSDCARLEGESESSREFARQAWNALPSSSASVDWFAASKMVRIGRSLLREGMIQEAEQLLRTGHDVLRAQLGDHHADTIVARDLLSEISKGADHRTPAWPAFPARRSEE